MLALGGLGSINWLVCTDTANTLQQLGAAPQDASLGAAGIGKDVAVCSRTWKWEWWTLFFEFAVLVSALVVTAMPSRLPRARYPLANLLSIASVLIMVGMPGALLHLLGWFRHGQLSALSFNASLAKHDALNLVC